MRFAAQTGTGRVLVFGDRAETNEHSPVELVGAALAACSAMDVVSILTKKRQVPESYTVTVDATQRAEYPQVLTRVDVLHDVSGPHLTEAAVHEAWTRRLYESLRSRAIGAYSNFLEIEGESRVREVYPARTYRRLAAVKRRYDPGNLFHLNQNIAPAP